MLETALVFLPRLALVALFLPFSALDKVLGFRGAVAQACGIGIGPAVGAAMVLAGLAVEVGGSLAVLTGWGDRPAALLLAAYCMATAVLYKRWWSMPGTIRPDGGDPARREAFFDFWKNLAVAGGFLMLAIGTDVEAARDFLRAPLASTGAYAAEGRP